MHVYTTSITARALGGDGRPPAPALPPPQAARPAISIQAAIKRAGPPAAVPPAEGALRSIRMRTLWPIYPSAVSSNTRAHIIIDPSSPLLQTEHHGPHPRAARRTAGPCLRPARPYQSNQCTNTCTTHILTVCVHANKTRLSNKQTCIYSPLPCHHAKTPPPPSTEHSHDPLSVTFILPCHTCRWRAAPPRSIASARPVPAKGAIGSRYVCK